MVANSIPYPKIPQASVSKSFASPVWGCWAHVKCCQGLRIPTGSWWFQCWSFSTLAGINDPHWHIFGMGWNHLVPLFFISAHVPSSTSTIMSPVLANDPCVAAVRNTMPSSCFKMLQTVTWCYMWFVHRYGSEKLGMTLQDLQDYLATGSPHISIWMLEKSMANARICCDGSRNLFTPNRSKSHSLPKSSRQLFAEILSHDFSHPFGLLFNCWSLPVRGMRSWRRLAGAPSTWPGGCRLGDGEVRSVWDSYLG